jgi:hypothetical protein
LSETIGTPTAGAPIAERGKILKFPTPLPETLVPSMAGIAAVVGGAAVSAPAMPSSPSAFQRLAAVRRRRADRAEAEPKTTKPLSTRPSVSQLVSWLLNLRRGGIGYLYWNAAKLPIEVALVRAARLHDDAIVDVVGHRILVVEPLRPRRVDTGLVGSDDQSPEPEALVP